MNVNQVNLVDSVVQVSYFLTDDLFLYLFSAEREVLKSPGATGFA